MRCLIAEVQTVAPRPGIARQPSIEMHPYDHQTKAGNQGDVVKHPALVAALHGLLVEHEGVFRYADSFAGRWDNALSASHA